jgi:hypothetical protein
MLLASLGQIASDVQSMMLDGARRCKPDGKKLSYSSRRLATSG